MISASQRQASCDGMEATLNGEPAVIEERDDPFTHRVMVVTSLVSGASGIWSWRTGAKIVAEGGCFRS
jgi:hypothetical protein